MSDCNKIVTDIYNHPDVLNLISKIKPESVRDDLRQEIAVSLLEQPCEKVAALFAADNLLRYAMGICWNMATGPRNYFARTYRRADLFQAIEYLRLSQPLPELSLSLADKAKMVLSSKNTNKNEDHEVRIFNKYVELGSCREVARYYGIPKTNVTLIVNKIKSELKCMLLQ